MFVFTLWHPLYIFMYPFIIHILDFTNPPVVETDEPKYLVMLSQNKCYVSFSHLNPSHLC